MAADTSERRKRWLRRHVRRLWAEQDRLFAPYDCGYSLAEYINPRLHEIRMELEAFEEEARAGLAQQETANAV